MLDNYGLLSLIVPSLVLVPVALILFVALSRGLRIRILASIAAVMVWVATYLLPWGDRSLWFVLASSTLGAAFAFLGVSMYYRIFKSSRSSDRFPNVRW